MSELRSEKFSKKSVHFNISTDAHGAFRVACFERNISMQEAQTPQVLKILDEMSDFKKNKTERKFSKQDAESIFDLIESKNRFND